MALAPIRPAFPFMAGRWSRLAMVPSRTVAVLAHIAANAIWAGSIVASKPLLAHFPPLTLATLRVAIALVVLRLMLGVRGERPATGTRIALLGLVGVAFYCATQNAGLLFADATTASLLGGMIPIFTVCLAVPVLGERYDAARFAGIAVSLVGIAWIVLPDADRPTGAAIGAAALPLASAFGSALSVVLGRRAHASGPALAIVTGSAMYGLLFLLPGAIVETAAVGVTMPGRNEIVALLYLGAGCSALAFVLRGYGLAHLEAGHGAVFGNLRPVMGVALAVLLLGEPLTGAQVGGGALVLAGVTIASRPWPSRRARRASPEPALALAAGPASTSMS